MFRLLTWAFAGKSPEEDSSVKALQEKINRLEQLLLQQADGDDQKQNDAGAEQREEKLAEPTNCFQKTGRVTDIRGDHVVIDKLYFVPKTLLQKCNGSETIEENTRLSFLVYRKHDSESGESSVKVVKILSIIDELWSAGGLAGNNEHSWETKDTKSTTGATEDGTVYFQGNRRREPGKVIARNGNEVTIETDAGDPLTVDMDKTRMSFVPMLGDYVTLDCLVQMDRDYVDFKGEVLEVLAIEPSRTVNGVGKISTVGQSGGEIFTVSGKYVYQSDCLVDSYRPSVDDSVSFQAIENEHVQMRCLSVKLATHAEEKSGGAKGGKLDYRRSNPPNKNEQATERTNNADGLWSDKQGIKIVGDFNVQLQNLEEAAVRKVTVTNESQMRHKIIHAMPLKPKKYFLVSLKSPSADAQHILYPGETIEYVFNVAGDSFFGRHHESWVWSFAGNFKIGRTFHISIGDKTLTGNGTDEAEVAATFAGSGYDRKLQILQQKLAALNVRREHTKARFVPGQSKVKKPNFVAFSIPMYSVPPDFFDLVLATQSYEELRYALGRSPYCLDEPLSARNYARLFDHYIFLEEIHQFIAFRRHDIERGHFTTEADYLVLHVPNIAESRPSVMVGDVVNASAPWSQEGDKEVPVYQGFIHKVLQNRVMLKFDSTFHARYNGESYRITFSYARGVYRKQHHAIGKVRTIMGPEYLFPETVVSREPSLNVRLNDAYELVLEEDRGSDSKGKSSSSRVLPWLNPNLNSYQKVAIANVLRSEARPLPYVIFGPPGTGKTITIIELIHQLSLNSTDCRLVVATPSNSAAYLITERLAKAGVLKAGDFVRLVSSNQVEREAIPEHLAPYCATVDISEDRNAAGQLLVTESGLRMKMQANHIGRHRVTISTCSCIGMLMHLRFPRNHFTHIIIDEAGQSVEPETLIPISLINRNVGSVTLVGDPKQLGPTVLNANAASYGYAISLLERLLGTARPYSIDRVRFPTTQGYDPRLVTKLCVNYRSTPSVLALYSDMFYDSHLLPHQDQTTVDNSELLTTLHGILSVKRPTADYGYFFCGIDGTNKQSPDSPSWFNPAEACMVHKIVERLYRKEYKPEEIGIIAPYVMQVKIIRHIFSAAKLEPPKVGSVEEFQGQERRIIVVSTVRSSRTLLSHDKDAVLGFVASPKRVNVAISRAKAALVIVGNPKLLSIDHYWHKIIQRAIDNETYVGCTLPPTLQPSKNC